MRGLGGATRKEQTREELLEAVRAERAARSGAKQRVKAAVTIQAAWRGHAARRALAAGLAAEWGGAFGPRVADPAARLGAAEVAGRLLPPFLFLLKPRRSPPAAAAIAAAPAASDPSPAKTDPAAAPVVLPPAGSPLSQLTRGSLALLLRSCTAADPADSYLALALAEKEDERAAWQQQAWRLLLACCRLVAAPRAGAPAAPPPSPSASTPSTPSSAPPPTAGDPVIDAAALRIAALLTDASGWKCLPPAAPAGSSHGGSGSGSSGSGSDAAGMQQQRRRAMAAAAAAALRSRLAARPQPLFAALGRALGRQQQQAAQAQAQAQAQQQQAGQEQPQPQAAAALAAQQQQQQQQQQTLSRLLSLALGVLCSALDLEGEGAGAGGGGRPPPAPEQGQGAGAAGQAAGAGGGAGDGGPAGTCLGAFAELVLGSPGAAALVPPDIQARLRETRVFAPLCGAVRRRLREGALRGPAQSAWCLANLLQLLLGPHMQQGPGVQGGQGDAGGKGMQGGGAPPSPSPSLSPLPPALWGPGGEVAAQLAATGAALMRHMAAGSLPACPDLAAASSGLWPLAQRGLLLPLLAALEPRPGGVEAYADLACAATELGPRLGTALKQAGVRAANPPDAVLNALAFSPGLLPRLWRWLCPALGLPLSCPPAATRGLDVAALHAGYGGLAPGHARVLGLFCRVYAQLLLVLDDGEFYASAAEAGGGGGGGAGGPPGPPAALDLGGARAVGAVLNSLVFHTYLPKPGPGGAPPPPAPPPGHPAFALLAEWAPRLLRMLYERDVRRPYCQALLWTAPYVEMFGQEQPPAPPPQPEGDEDGPHAAAGPDPAAAPLGPFTAGTVLAALAGGGAGGEEEGGAGAGAEGVALQSRPGEGCRPASLAALLRATPQAVPFPRRVDLLRALLAADRQRGGWDLPGHAGGPPPVKITIRRAALIEDAYRGLAGLGSGLKARLQVTFINEAGMPEAGLDFGGLQKELLERVVSAGLDANYGLFTATPDGLAYPAPAAERVDGGLALLEFMGLMFGKALYEGILLPVPFALFFVARLQGRQPLFDDLATLDPELHRSLLQVKRYAGDVSDLGLTFAAEEHVFGAARRTELLPGGSDTPVTNDSRLLYVHLLAEWQLAGRLGAPTGAFARGLFHLIPQSCLRLFNPREFNQLLSGAAPDGGPGGGGAAALDVADMRRHARYSGGYRPDSSAVKLFWRVLAELSPAEQAALLRFVTSCSRPPLGGFRYLQPPLTIHKVECDAGLFAALGGRDVDRLPSASTCYNMLKLPNYRRAATLKTKLLYSITSGAGFELS